MAAHRLAMFGARVTRIEPLAGDPMADMSRDWYDELRAGQRVLRLDVRSTRGKDVFDRLLDRADLLLTALRPSALTRLGLSWEALHPRFPRLSHVAIVGQASPHGDVPGHDLTYQVQAGLTTPPHLPRTLLADLAGAERAVSAALALLLARERGHGAGRVEVSLADAAESFAAPLRHGITQPGGVLGGGHAGYRFYRARDGWVAVGALEPHFWTTLLAALGLESTADQARVESVFITNDATHWEVWSRERGIPIVAVT